MNIAKITCTRKFHALQYAYYRVMLYFELVLYSVFVLGEHTPTATLLCIHLTASERAYNIHKSATITTSDFKFQYLTKIHTTGLPFTVTSSHITSSHITSSHITSPGTIEWQLLYMYIVHATCNVMCNSRW